MQKVVVSILALLALACSPAQMEETPGVGRESESTASKGKSKESSTSSEETLTRAELEQLVFLGYVEGTPVDGAEPESVTRHRPGAREGCNLCVGESTAVLVAMDGSVLHQWSRDLGGGWSDCVVYPNGDLVVLSNLDGLFRLDRDSRVLWSYEDLAHHTFSVDEDGDIYFLALQETVEPRLHPTFPCVSDVVVVLDGSGNLRWMLDLVDLFLRSPHADLLPTAETIENAALKGAKSKTGKDGFDVMHVNRVEVFDGSLEHLGPLYARGNLLLSSRTLDAVFVVNPKSREILWLWGPGELHHQHCPTSLPNGRFLVFDNGRERSRVIEVDPNSNEVVHVHGPAEGFFSKTRGCAQRLDNGNTLITESDTGRAFEVTRAGETVWEYHNPMTENGVRKPLWEVSRLGEVSRFLVRP